MITLVRFVVRHPVVAVTVIAAATAVTWLARRANPQVQAEAAIWRQRLGQLHHDDGGDQAPELDVEEDGGA